MGSSLQSGTARQESGTRHSRPSTGASSRGANSQTRSFSWILNQEEVDLGWASSRISTREDGGVIRMRFLRTTAVQTMSEYMDTVELPDFLLVSGGFLFQLLRKTRLCGDSLELLRRRTLILSSIA